MWQTLLNEQIDDLHGHQPAWSRYSVTRGSSDVPKRRSFVSVCAEPAPSARALMAASIDCTVEVSANLLSRSSQLSVVFPNGSKCGNSVAVGGDGGVVTAFWKSFESGLLNESPKVGVLSERKATVTEPVVIVGIFLVNTFQNQTKF